MQSHLRSLLHPCRQLLLLRNVEPLRPRERRLQPRERRLKQSQMVRILRALKKRDLDVQQTHRIQTPSMGSSSTATWGNQHLLIPSSKPLSSTAGVDMPPSLPFMTRMVMLSPTRQNRCHRPRQWTIKLDILHMIIHRYCEENSKSHIVSSDQRHCRHVKTSVIRKW